MIRFLLPLTCLLLLTGCSNNTPEAVLADYLDRVANSLDREPAAVEPPETTRLPRRRERRLPVTELRAGVLETLDFSACDLLPLIAERNSSLGKVMLPSTLMRYELRFFDRLLPCYLQDRQQPLRDARFSALLSETYRTKRANLGAVVWNGIFTSEAVEHNLSLASPPLPLAGNPGYGDSLRALQALDRYRRLVERFDMDGRFELPADLDQVETHYEALAHSDYGSQLFRSLALLTQTLDRAAATLEEVLARRPVCFDGRPNPRARILKTVFLEYYAGRVQPYMAQVQRQGGPWLQAFGTLMQPRGLPVSGTVAGYRQRMLGTAPGTLWQDYQRAIHRHTEAWQTLLKQCGLMPRGPAP